MTNVRKRMMQLPVAAMGAVLLAGSVMPAYAADNESAVIADVSHVRANMQAAQLRQDTGIYMTEVNALNTDASKNLTEVALVTAQTLDKKSGALFDVSVLQDKGFVSVASYAVEIDVDGEVKQAVFQVLKIKASGSGAFANYIDGSAGLTGFVNTSGKRAADADIKDGAVFYADYAEGMKVDNVKAAGAAAEQAVNTGASVDTQVMRDDGIVFGENVTSEFRAGKGAIFAATCPVDFSENPDVFSQAVTVDAEGGQVLTVEMTDGSKLKGLPETCMDGMTQTGWTDASGKAVKSNLKITDKSVYTATYKEGVDKSLMTLDTDIKTGDDADTGSDKDDNKTEADDGNKKDMGAEEAAEYSFSIIRSSGGAIGVKLNKSVTLMSFCKEQGINSVKSLKQKLDNGFKDLPQGTTLEDILEGMGDRVEVHAYDSDSQPVGRAIITKGDAENAFNVTLTTDMVNDDVQQGVVNDGTNEADKNKENEKDKTESGNKTEDKTEEKKEYQSPETVPENKTEKKTPENTGKEDKTAEAVQTSDKSSIAVIGGLIASVLALFGMGVYAMHTKDVDLLGFFKKKDNDRE